tara:strand:+ start:515 stop:685 length:171 start_codon:yes stop_codon:yes gene_type:complete
MSKEYNHEPLTDEEVKDWKEELGKNDPFGFTNAINFDVLQDKEKFNKIAEILDKIN